LKRTKTSFRRLDAIVPLKDINKSKARLSPVLRPAARSGLTIAMLSHVLSTLTKVGLFRTIIVVSGDRSVRALAEDFGAHFVWEGKRRGLNRALRLAIHESLSKNSSKVLIVHADLPLLTPADVIGLVMKSRGYSVTLAPSKDGSGTNAILLAPPSVLPPAFGKHSFMRYLALANQIKLKSRVIRSRGFGFDVDEPEDFRALMHYRSRGLSGELPRLSVRSRPDAF
jgi:2-phospho-L-lactate guanylyltransferase